MRKLSQIHAAQAATTESKPQTSKPASNSSAKPKADKKPAKKQTTKKEPAKPTELNPIEKSLKAYFEQEAKTDKEFAAKYAEGKKTVHHAFKYLYELHRPENRGQVAATDNDEDNLLAKKFIMDDSIPAEPKKTAPTKEVAAKPQPKDDADLDLDDLDDGYTPDADEQAEADAEYRASKPCNRKPSKPKDKPKTEKPKAKKSEPTIFDDDLDDFDF